MEDLLELIDVERRGRPARPAPVAGDGVVAAPAEAAVVAAAAEGAAPDEVEDLRELAQICRARPERRHEQRSWQATQHARAAKKQEMTLGLLRPRLEQRLPRQRVLLWPASFRRLPKRSA